MCVWTYFLHTHNIHTDRNYSRYVFLHPRPFLILVWFHLFALLCHTALSRSCTWRHVALSSIMSHGTPGSSVGPAGNGLRPPPAGAGSAVLLIILGDGFRAFL